MPGNGLVAVYLFLNDVDAAAYHGCGAAHVLQGRFHHLLRESEEAAGRAFVDDIVERALGHLLAHLGCPSWVAPRAKLLA